MRSLSLQLPWFKSAAHERELRLRELVSGHFEFVWRSVKRLGVAPGDADDAAQQVFLVASDRLADIAPGRERAFLFGTALKIAARHRRTAERRRECGDGVPLAMPD